MTDYEKVKSCPLCGARGIPDSTCGTFGCIGAEDEKGFPVETDCYFSVREHYLPEDVWQSIIRPSGVAADLVRMEADRNAKVHALGVTQDALTELGNQYDALRERASERQTEAARACEKQAVAEDRADTAEQFLVRTEAQYKYQLARANGAFTCIHNIANCISDNRTPSAAFAAVMQSAEIIGEWRAERNKSEREVDWADFDKGDPEPIHAEGAQTCACRKAEPDEKERTAGPSCLCCTGGQLQLETMAGGLWLYTCPICSWWVPCSRVGTIPPGIKEFWAPFSLRDGPPREDD